MLPAVIFGVRWVLRPDRRRCIPSAWHSFFEDPGFASCSTTVKSSD
jgi:hypothetical protein